MKIQVVVQRLTSLQKNDLRLGHTNTYPQQKGHGLSAETILAGARIELEIYNEK